MNVGWKYIWKLYGWKELLSKRNKLLYFTAILVVIALSIILISNQINLAYILINEITNVALSIMPTLLGFNLGAYALIIGFLTNKNLLKALTNKQNGETANSLEKLSGIFAFNIIAQAFTLLVAYLIKEVMVFIENIKLDHCLNKIFYNNIYVHILNDSIFFIIMFLTIYSIMLVIQNAINIFDFNQLFTYFSMKEDDEKGN